MKESLFEKSKTSDVINLPTNIEFSIEKDEITGQTTDTGSLQSTLNEETNSSLDLNHQGQFAESPTKKFKQNQQLSITEKEISMRSDDTSSFQGDLGELMRKNTGKSIIVMNFINNDEDIE